MTVIAGVQTYLSFLLHTDQISMVPLQWAIAPFYLPLYIVLLLISGSVEWLTGWSIGPTGMGYVQDEVWWFGIVIMMWVNHGIVRVFARWRR
ncbi:hypothetical protein L4C36_15240 [Photobacterium japonica]|uniref:hypothetical protein n=1 Tax=Photobacterium japonica TaxID=2910235 RepID=UPI003D1472FC